MNIWFVISCTFPILYGLLCCRSLKLLLWKGPLGTRYYGIPSSLYVQFYRWALANIWNDLMMILNIDLSFLCCFAMRWLIGNAPLQAKKKTGPEDDSSEESSDEEPQTKKIKVPVCWHNCIQIQISLHFNCNWQPSSILFSHLELQMLLNQACKLQKRIAVVKKKVLKRMKLQRCKG